jgi:hypothetical protein
MSSKTTEPGTSEAVHKQVAKAANRVLGSKFCFACANYRQIDTGKTFIRAGGKRVWKCYECWNRLRPSSQSSASGS